MKIDRVTLELFAWDDLPVADYAAFTGRLAPSSQLGLLTIGTDAGIEGHAFLGSAEQPASVDAGGLIRSL